MSNREPISDDDLDKLLGELANTDPLDSKEIKEKTEEKLEKGVVVVPPKPRKKPTIDVSVDDDILMLQQTQPEPSGDLSVVFSKQLERVASQYGAVFEEIIKNYKRDREQAQEVIDNFMDVIAAGGKVPRVYLEKVADAVRAKNEIAQTAIKALDSLPKLISATKGNDLFTNNVGISFDSSHLKEILDKASKEDE